MDDVLEWGRLAPWILVDEAFLVGAGTWTQMPPPLPGLVEDGMPLVVVLAGWFAEPLAIASAGTAVFPVSWQWDRMLDPVAANKARAPQDWALLLCRRLWLSCSPLQPWQSMAPAEDLAWLS